MRVAAVTGAVVACLATSGCTLLFSGDDLHGSKRGSDMSMPRGALDMTVPDLWGASRDDLALAGDDLGHRPRGDGGATGCVPIASVSFTVSQPSTGATTSGGGPYEQALADINGDGELDIVTGNFFSNTFSVLLGDGKGGFALSLTGPFPTCTSPQFIAVRDITNDQKPDVIISCADTSGATPAGATIWAHINNSTKTNVSFSTIKKSAPPSTTVVYFMAMGNFDSDSKPDVALVDTTTSTNSTVNFMSGDGTGSFSSVGTTNVTAGMGANSIGVGKLNSDAIDDLVVYNYGESDMTMLLSKSGGGYATTRLAYTTTGTVSYGGAPPIITDIDNDGINDIVETDGSAPGMFFVFRNSGSASSPMFPATGLGYTIADNDFTLAVADLNCDRLPDLVASSNGCDPAMCGQTDPPQMSTLLRTPGALNFATAQITTIPSGCLSLSAADLDHDGYVDLVCGGDSTSVTVFLSAH
jgi:hypothetical protein